MTKLVVSIALAPSPEESTYTSTEGVSTPAATTVTRADASRPVTGSDTTTVNSDLVSMELNSSDTKYRTARTAWLRSAFLYFTPCATPAAAQSLAKCGNTSWQLQRYCKWLVSAPGGRSRSRDAEASMKIASAGARTKRSSPPATTGRRRAWSTSMDTSAKPLEPGVALWYAVKRAT